MSMSKAQNRDRLSRNIYGIQVDPARRVAYRRKVYVTYIPERETQLYRHFDGDGKLLYVGISVCAITRLRQHKKSSPWFDQIRLMTIETYASRGAAIAAEREAILNGIPVHNRNERLWAAICADNQTAMFHTYLTIESATFWANYLNNRIGHPPARIYPVKRGYRIICK
jgi:hypothetical protein